MKLDIKPKRQSKTPDIKTIRIPKATHSKLVELADRYGTTIVATAEAVIDAVHKEVMK
jgi:formaldehyde-activating enzyme involved in methanogenesis